MATEEFREMFEESLQQIEPPESGQIITTSVIQVTDKEVVLDVGAKSESRIDLSEFKTAPQVGDELEVLVEKSGLNYIKVSHKRAEERKAFLKVKEAAENEEMNVSAKVAEVIKGGFKVLLENHINAFLPLSQIEIKRVDQPENYLNQTFPVRVLRFEKKGRNLNIVVSRRPILEEEQKKKLEVFYGNLNVGDEVAARVVKINPKSVIVEIDNLETGMIRIGDLSWNRINHPKDIVQENESIKAKVLDIDPEKRNILLSVKDLKEDPWVTFANEHQPGDVVKGEIVKITARSVFARIAEGIDGIIRFEDLSWSRGIKKPEDAVAVNTIVDAQILSMDPEKKRLSLGLKQVMGNPWEDIDEKYPEGKKIQGTITGKQDFGLFIEVEAGIEALLHKNDIDWNLKKINLDEYKIGDKIEAIVLKADPVNRKMSLGIKQLFDNPWQNFISENPKGSRITVPIKEIQEERLIMDLGNEMEGEIFKNQLAKKVENLSEEYKVGDKLEAMVYEVNPGRNILRLSVREMLRKEREKEVAKYMNQEETSEATLGDFFGKNLEMLKNKISSENEKAKEKAEAQETENQG
jgi:small subunit ribosomal protein S1